MMAMQTLVARRLRYEYHPYEPEMLPQLSGQLIKQWHISTKSRGKRDVAAPWSGMAETPDLCDRVHEQRLAERGDVLLGIPPEDDGRGRDHWLATESTSGDGFGRSVDRVQCKHRRHNLSSSPSQEVHGKGIEGFCGDNPGTRTIACSCSSRSPSIASKSNSSRRRWLGPRPRCTSLLMHTKWQVIK